MHAGQGQGPVASVHHPIVAEVNGVRGKGIREASLTLWEGADCHGHEGGRRSC